MAGREVVVVRLHLTGGEEVQVVELVREVMSLLCRNQVVCGRSWGLRALFVSYWKDCLSLDWHPHTMSENISC